MPSTATGGAAAVATVAAAAAAVVTVCGAVPAPPPVPSFALRNAAVAGLTMPAIGLGTGGYGTNPASPTPECWGASHGCGAVAQAATVAWLGLGGRRIDAADTYDDDEYVGAGMAASGLPRGEIFVLSKIGSGAAMGYTDTLAQFQGILARMNINYVDALLIHWPTSLANSSEPSCQVFAPTYNATECRLQTWRAMVSIFNGGGALSIGVSNYNASHLMEIVDAGLPLPAINQCPFHVYRSSSQAATRAYCKANGILFHGYSPLGEWWREGPAAHRGWCRRPPTSHRGAAH